MKGNILLGVLAGVAVGAAIGVLLAPDKGEKTREKLAKKGEEYFDDLKESMDGLKSKYAEVMERMNEKYESMKDQFGTAANAGGHTRKA
jgi:gas vesicle protein